MSLQQQWAVSGKHYSRTLEDWLQRQDRQRAEVLAIMKVQFCLTSVSRAEHACHASRGQSASVSRVVDGINISMWACREHMEMIRA